MVSIGSMNKSHLKQDRKSNPPKVSNLKWRKIRADKNLKQILEVDFKQLTELTMLNLCLHL